jgi:DNA-binding transcriptional ArsR family regulator
MSGFNLPKKPKLKLREPPPPSRFAVVPSRAIGDERLTNRQFRVLAALSSFANRGGFLWAGQQAIGAKLGITKQAASLHIKKLREKGYVERVSGGIWGQRGDTNRIIYDQAITASEALALASSDDIPPAIEHKRNLDMARGKRKAIDKSKPIEETNQEQTVDITTREPFEAYCLEMEVELRKSESDLLGDQLIASIDWATHADTFAAFVRTLRPSSYTKAVRAYLQAL